MTDPNPLIPAAYDITWSILAVAVLALTISALISLGRFAKELTLVQALMWTLIVILAPVIGSLTWLWIGRRSLVAARSRTP